MRMTGWLLATCLATVAIGPAPGRAQERPVKIGVLGDMSSVYSDASGKGSVAAARLAIEDAGPVLGSPVELVEADHQQKADVGSSIAQRWYGQDGVDMITDVPNSAVGLAVAQLANQLHKPALLVGTLSTDLTGERCGPYTAAWSIDTYSQAKVVGSAVVRNGGDTWFFLGADYGFGRSLARDGAAVVAAAGGKVLGSVFAPLGSSDFSSFLLQAQQSRAKVIGLANAAGDTANSLKQAEEFGMRQAGQRFAAFVMFPSDVRTVGLQAAQGLLLSDAFYWDTDDATRAFARRFQPRVGFMPMSPHAAVYSAVAHYLKAVKAVGSRDPDKVMAKMRELPVEDFATHGGRLRADGRLIRDMFLFEVKSPEQSHGPDDIYRRVATVPGDEAFRPLSEGHCPIAR